MKLREFNMKAVAETSNSLRPFMSPAMLDGLSIWIIKRRRLYVFLLLSLSVKTVCLINDIEIKNSSEARANMTNAVIKRRLCPWAWERSVWGGGASEIEDNLRKIVIRSAARRMIQAGSRPVPLAACLPAAFSKREQFRPSVTHMLPSLISVRCLGPWVHRQIRPPAIKTFKV